MKKIIAIAALSALTACSSAEVQHASLDQAATPSADGKSKIVIYRTSFLGFAVQPQVAVDGRATGRCTPGQKFEVAAKPGNHTLSATTEKEVAANVPVQAGSTTYVRCSLSTGVVAGRPKFEVVAGATGAAEAAKLKTSAKY